MLIQNIYRVPKNASPTPNIPSLYVRPNHQLDVAAQLEDELHTFITKHLHKVEVGKQQNTPTLK